MKVSIVKTDYGVMEALKRAIDAIGGMERYVCRDDSVMIKPNLNDTIKPTLNIIDCISCMERIGPKGGDIVNLNTFIAGESAAETDFVGSTVMGYSVDEIGYLELFGQMNGISFQDTEIVGERIANVQYPFKKVGMDGIIPPVFRLNARDACSTCMNVFIASCEKIGVLPERPMDVYLGAGWDQTDSSVGEGIVFGNCAVKCLKKGMAVKGCPPVRSALKKALEAG